MNKNHKNRSRETQRWCSELLEGKNVNLRVAERNDIDFLVEYTNDIDIEGNTSLSSRHRRKNG
jgi:hypothetical protein